jgi:hypothetical protein
MREKAVSAEEKQDHPGDHSTPYPAPDSERIQHEPGLVSLLMIGAVVQQLSLAIPTLWVVLEAILSVLEPRFEP